MILQFPNNVSYFLVIKAGRILGVYHYLSDNREDSPNNETIHNLCKITTNVVESDTEADVGTSFINSSEAVPECTTLK